MNKESWQLLKEQKRYSKSTNVKEMAKKLKMVSLKIHEGAQIRKKNQNLSK